MAYEPVTSLHRLEYSQNVALATQQLTPKFPDTFTFQPNMMGKAARAITLFGAEEPIIDGARGGDTPHIEGSNEQVWMKPRQLEWGKIIEKEDTIKAAIDLQSPYVRNGAATIVRGTDKICAEAFFAPRMTGDQGLTLTPYTPTANINLVPVDYVASGATANSGLTFAKLAWGRTLFVNNEVDIESEDLWCAITGHEENDLYNQVQFLNKDYRERTVVDDASKRVTSFMGINFKRYQKLPFVTGSTTIHRIPLYCKSGMHYGEFSALETTIERNPQKKYRLHPYMETWRGATRSEDVKVVDIRCDITA